MHMVKFNTTTFHYGLKIAAQCFIQDQLDTTLVTWTLHCQACSDSDITQLTVRLLLGDLLLVGRTVHCKSPKFAPKTQIQSMLQRVFSLLIDDNQQPYSKDTGIKNAQRW